MYSTLTSVLPDQFTPKSLIAGLGLLYVVWRVIERVLSSRARATAKLRGPPSPEIVFGNLPQLFTFKWNRRLMDTWLNDYGLVFGVHDFMFSKAIFIADPVAASHIFKNYMNYTKPPGLIADIKKSVGPGLAAAEGYDHQRQRKVINPAFNISQIKLATESVILDKVYELRDIWLCKIYEARSTTCSLDILDPLNNLILDIIGETGFGCAFDALKGSNHELGDAFKDLEDISYTVQILRLLGRYIPPITHLPFADNIKFKNSLATIRRVAARIVKEKKIELTYCPGTDLQSVLGKDLMSVLIKSNMLNPKSQSMSDDEIESQIATLMIAGKDATASALAWTLYAVSKDTRVQSKLRDEVMAFPHDRPSLNELDGMEYLDWVIRESLRVYSPLQPVLRYALHDDVIPLSEPIIDKDGKYQDRINVKAGESIIISTTALSISTRFWGPDADDFRPERFANLPASTNSIPSVYGGVPVFLSGSRACIGWRHAVAQMKVTLFVLLRSFDIKINPEHVVRPSLFAAIRPHVPKVPGVQLPLEVSLLREGTFHR